MSFMSPLQNKYKIGNKEYKYNPSLLRMHYEEFTDMSDADFIQSISRVLHFACFMSFVKNLSHIDTLSDQGIIHELVHLANENTRKYSNIKEIREKFEDLFADIPNKFDIDAKYPYISGQ